MPEMLQSRARFDLNWISQMLLAPWPSLIAIRTVNMKTETGWIVFGE